METFQEWMMKLWNEWYPRLMVLLSLLFQIILVILGNKRKYTARHWVKFILWVAYMSANSVATISLGILSKTQKGAHTHEHKSLDPNYIITALWAPFLLLHLGGADVITAYALEDNELWLRHLMTLLAEVGVAFYVILGSWTGTTLNLLAIPVFVAGTTKYLERTWTLRSASSDYFRESLLPRPNPGRDYPKVVAEYIRRRDQGRSTTPQVRVEAYSIYNDDRDIAGDAKIFHNAYFLFLMLRRLYAKLILSFQDHKHSISIFKYMTPVNAFKLVEIELGFMYDVLYTKSATVNSLTGIFLRSITFCSTLLSFVVFVIAIDKRFYSKINVILTYLLFSVAILLEVYAMFQQLSSDWTLLWLFPKEETMFWLRSKQFKPFGFGLIHRCVSSYRAFATKSTQRWSHSVSQFNLLNFCLKEYKKTKCKIIIQKLIQVVLSDTLEKELYHRSLEEVPIHLKEMIFNRLHQRSVLYANDLEACRKFCSLRGDRALRERNCLDILGWSINEVEFDQSILLWHIATDLLCHTTSGLHEEEESNKWAIVSKLLGDYILFLLVMRPFMLPEGIGQIRFQDTVAEANRFFKDELSQVVVSKSEACKKLLEVRTEEIQPYEVKGDKSKSVLFNACRLAKSLESLVKEEKRLTNEQRWEMVSLVWVDMLFYAANRCGWRHHAQQLREGGEMLTHVCLLMTHLGLSEHFQILQGGSRTYY